MIKKLYNAIWVTALFFSSHSESILGPAVSCTFSLEGLPLRFPNGIVQSSPLNEATPTTLFYSFPAVPTIPSSYRLPRSLSSLAEVSPAWAPVFVQHYVLAHNTALETQIFLTNDQATHSLWSAQLISEPFEESIWKINNGISASDKHQHLYW